MMTEGTFYLKPGHLFASSDPLWVTTVLGSCVAVCLYDHRLHLGGMNHYLQPRAKAPEDRTTQFGDVAIGVLVRTLRDLGSRVSDLEASVLGGASLEKSESSLWVAEQNAAVARELLGQKWNIPVVFEETGGYRGRKVVFHTVTGVLEWAFLDRRGNRD